MSLSLHTGNDGKAFGMSWGQKRAGGAEAAAMERNERNKALGKALFTRVSRTEINHHTMFGHICPNPREEGAKFGADLGVWCGGRTSPRTLQFQQG